MCFRVKRTGTYAYLQIVESFREQGQAHQRVLSTVGRVDALQASGQLDALMRSGLRFCEKLAVIDAHAAGQTGPAQVQRVCLDLVTGRAERRRAGLDQWLPVCLPFRASWQMVIRSCRRFLHHL